MLHITRLNKYVSYSKLNAFLVQQYFEVGEHLGGRELHQLRNLPTLRQLVSKIGHQDLCCDFLFFNYDGFSQITTAT